MNETDNRRKKIIEVLKKNSNPISGTKLAEKFNVSRQVIVQDIAILKAENYKIISTNRGYKIFTTDASSRVFKLMHSDEEIEKELNIVVDLGAVVKDVFVWHKAYGKIYVELNIKSRKDIKKLLEDIKSGVSRPLKGLTENYHYHTVIAEDEETLDEIEKSWRELGFILEE